MDGASSVPKSMVKINKGFKPILLIIKMMNCHIEIKIYQLLPNGNPKAKFIKIGITSGIKCVRVYAIVFLRLSNNRRPS
jgi:hypothetical protein